MIPPPGPPLTPKQIAMLLAIPVVITILILIGEALTKGGA
jgi:hypothetical protein